MSALARLKPPACGITLIKNCESCRLKAYQDQAGIWTIGWGKTENVYPQMTCSQKQADDWLTEECEHNWLMLRKYVKVPLTEAQGGALLSFLYNVGLTAFIRSTLLRVLNSGGYTEVSDEMRRWNKITVNGKKEVCVGLVNRREKEISLWESKGGD